MQKWRNSKIGKSIMILVWIVFMGNFTIGAGYAQDFEIVWPEVHGQDARTYVADEIVIKLAYDPPESFSATSTGNAGLNALMAQFGVTEAVPLFENISDSSLSRIYKLELPSNSNMEEVKATLSDAASVEYAEFNYFVYAEGVPNDPLFNSDQWNLNIIRAAEAWDVPVDASSQVLAILDTGMGLAHEDLASKNAGTGYDFVNTDNDPSDDHGHGSLIAGIAAADTDNNTGVAGVCPDCQIMSVKVMNEGLTGNAATVAQGITYAVDNGATVINLSLGVPFNFPPLQTAINYAVDNNVPVVASVGNWGTGNDDVRYPAKYSNVIAVAATTRNDQRANYSNKGSEIDIAAPGGDFAAGEAVISTYSKKDNADDVNDYRGGAGTSMAAAHVTGALGILRAICPNATPDELRTILKDTADDIGTAAIESGAGRLNLEAAVLAASARNLSVNPDSRDFGSLSVGTSSPAQTFTITNTENGCAGLRLDPIALTGADAGEFSIRNNTCSDLLGGGESCGFEVIFSPASSGDKSATIPLNSDDPDTPAVTIQLTGKGTQEPVISGYVRTTNGTGIAGVLLNGLPGNIATDSNGFYSVEVNSGWNGTVAPQFGTSVFTPPDRGYANITSEQADQNYETDMPTYTISGFIRYANGDPRPDVKMNGLPGNPTTNDEGLYSVIVDYGWSGTVTPEMSFHNFDPSNKSYTTVTSDQNEDYTASLIPHTISGYVRNSDGTAVEGVTFEVEGRVITPTTDNSGFYTLEVEHAWAGKITPRKSGLTFVPSDFTYGGVIDDLSDNNYTAFPLEGIDCGSPTIQSNGSGPWDVSGTWTPARIPNANDIVSINPGHTVTGTAFMIRIKGLCNSGTLLSSAETNLRVTASDFIYNSGRIWGADGAPRRPGIGVVLNARIIHNAQEGDIQAGRGGNHFAGNARGGAGGTVEIYGNKITNEGTIGPECDSGSSASDGGNGGSGISGSDGGSGIGGNGGDTILMADDTLINMGSGTIFAGAGGFGRGERAAGGLGGRVTFSAPVTVPNGTLRACGNGTRRIISVEPYIAIAGSTAQMEAEQINIFGGDNWNLDLRNLSPEAIIATDTLTIAVGHGGVVDLRGVTENAFKAEKAEIYSDEIKLDEGVQLSDIFNATEIVTGEAKILYDVVLTAPKLMIGAVESTVTVDISLINNSPVEDTYTLSVTDTEGWSLGDLPNTVSVASLKRKQLTLNVTLPDTAGLEDVITITAVSHADPEATAETEVTVYVKHTDDDWDNDGLPNTQEYELGTDPMSVDSDGDVMPDAWEAEHGLNPADPEDASADSDGDEFSNLREYEADTDPLNADSRPVTGLTNILYLNSTRGWGTGELGFYRHAIADALNNYQDGSTFNVDFVQTQMPGDLAVKLGEKPEGYYHQIWFDTTIYESEILNEDDLGSLNKWAANHQPQFILDSSFVYRNKTSDTLDASASAVTINEALALRESGRGIFIGTDHDIYIGTANQILENFGFDSLFTGDFEVTADGSFVGSLLVGSEPVTDDFYTHHLQELTTSKIPVGTHVLNENGGNRTIEIYEGMYSVNAGNKVVHIGASFDTGNDETPITSDAVNGHGGVVDDTDGDSIPDDWESAHGLNPLVDDAAGDPDKDGLSNLEEYENGTDPMNADTDGDAMPDGWEVEHGLNPLADDASMDADGDAFSNLKEYEQNTDPTDPDDPGAVPVDSDGDGVPDSEDTDDDNDGMPDTWEVEYGLNPLADDASEDLDDDGYSNLEEYDGNTNPFDSDSYPSSNGLVACYPFNGNADDKSGNGNDGTVHGATLATDRFGRTDSAYNFDGTDDYILVSDDDTLDPSDGLTLTAWIKSESTSGPRVIVSKWDDNTWGHSYIFKDHNYSDKLRMSLSQGDHHNLGDLEGANSIPLGSWIHVATTYDSEILRIYFNGVQEVSLSAPGSIKNSATALLIGAVYTGGGITEIFKGAIDDVHIYNRALSEAEIQKLYGRDCECSNECASPSPFEAGVFTVEESGIVKVDWLYDGGAYKGELGIFSLRDMEDLEPGSEAFIAEAVTRVLSDTEDGHIVLTDPTEGARFSGSLGESTDRNSGEYSGIKSFEMRPGDWFATILVPNGTFNTLANNPGTTNPHLRPLFSLVSTNPAHGMYLGQIADINGMGTAFAYEDKSADNSDWDYNDLIIQITGATIDDVPGIDELKGAGQQSRSKRGRRDWFDWRTGTELGETIMEHLDAQIVEPDTVWLSAAFDTLADVTLRDPSERIITRNGGHIPGATYGTDTEGYWFVSLPTMEEGGYSIVLQGSEDETGTVTFTKRQGEEIILSQDTQTFDVEAHRTISADVTVDSAEGDISVSTVDEPEAGPYDFDNNGVIDDADIGNVSALWNVCEGDEGYEPFFDLDDDGCVTVLDIMSVVNSRSAQ